MTLRIINNKRIELSEDEWILYQKIVRSYTVNNNKGEDLFIDLFEVDNDGYITMLIPPSQRQTSFEVWLFLMSIQQNQQLRLMRSLIDDEIKQIKDKLSSL